MTVSRDLLWGSLVFNRLVSAGSAGGPAARRPTVAATASAPSDTLACNGLPASRWRFQWGYK